MNSRNKIYTALCACLLAGTVCAQRTYQTYNLLDEPGELTATAGDNRTLACINDKDDDTVFSVPFSGTVQLFFHSQKPLTVTAMMVVGSDNTAAAPRRFTLYGSTDGQSWTRVASALGADIQPREATVLNANYPAPYTHYRIDFLSVASGDLLELAELQLLGYPSDVLAGEQLPTEGLTTADTGNTSLPNLASDKPADTFRQTGAKTCWMQYEAAEPMTLDAYAMMSAQGSRLSDSPRSWQLLASADGQTWNVIDSRFNRNFLAANNNMQRYSLTAAERKYDWAQMAEQAHKSMIDLFWAQYGTGYYLRHGYHPNATIVNDGFNYWWMAHVIDVMVDGYRRTGNRDYRTRANQVYQAMLSYGQKVYGHSNLWNGFFDDMEWMALASMRADQEWGSGMEKRWAEAATDLWEWIKVGWNESNNDGGIQWNDQAPTSKNACSNAPAAIIAARMYKLTGDESHLEWAKKIWEWQSTHLLFDNGIVKDGVGNDNWGWTFTYNQGTWIGAGMELYGITGERKYLDAAVKTADYVVNDWEKFSPNGILIEGGSSDGGLFKGIFIRYLTQLVLSGHLDAERENHYTQYLMEQGKNLWEAATLKPECMFNATWDGRPKRLEASSTDTNERYDASVHLSAVMMFEMLAELERAGKLPEGHISPETVANRGKSYRFFRLEILSNAGGSNVELSKWRLFFSSTTGIRTAEVSPACSVKPCVGGITVDNRGAEPCLVQVLTTDGRLVKTARVASTENISLAQGLYIVRLSSKHLTTGHKVCVA